MAMVLSCGIEQVSSRDQRCNLCRSRNLALFIRAARSREWEKIRMYYWPSNRALETEIYKERGERTLGTWFLGSSWVKPLGGRTPTGICGGWKVVGAPPEPWRWRARYEFRQSGEFAKKIWFHFRRNHVERGGLRREKEMAGFSFFGERNGGFFTDLWFVTTEVLVIH